MSQSGQFTAEVIGPRVVVALDFPAARDALALVDRLDPARCRLKVGKELFTRAGPQVIEQLRRRGFDVFLDLKYHDIPNTVAAACVAAAELGVWMVNLHASGGRRMMAAAVEALAGITGPAPLLTGVTVLTSMGSDDLGEIGIDVTPEEQVLRLARLAFDAGLDGVVCSAREAAAIRASTGQGFRLVTPGIRLPDAAQDDQRRITTPTEAVRAGADYLVIGRPITAAADPSARLGRIADEIDAARAD